MKKMQTKLENMQIQKNIVKYVINMLVEQGGQNI